MNAKGKRIDGKKNSGGHKTYTNLCKKTPISMKWKEDPRKSRFRGSKKLELEKEEIQLKTRMTVSQ